MHLLQTVIKSSKKENVIHKLLDETNKLIDTLNVSDYKTEVGETIRQAISKSDPNDTTTQKKIFASFMDFFSQVPAKQQTKMYEQFGTLIQSSLFCNSKNNVDNEGWDLKTMLSLDTDNYVTDTVDPRLNAFLTGAVTCSKTHKNMIDNEEHVN